MILGIVDIRVVLLLSLEINLQHFCLVAQRLSFHRTTTWWLRSAGCQVCILLKLAFDFFAAYLGNSWPILSLAHAMNRRIRPLCKGIPGVGNKPVWTNVHNLQTLVSAQLSNCPPNQRPDRVNEEREVVHSQRNRSSERHSSFKSTTTRTALRQRLSCREKTAESNLFNVGRLPELLPFPEPQIRPLSIPREVAKKVWLALAENRTKKVCYPNTSIAGKLANGNINREPKSDFGQTKVFFSHKASL